MGILRAEFGRRRSRALTNAMIQLAAEEAWNAAQEEAAPGLHERMRRWCAALRPGQQWALGTALAVIIAVTVWIWWPFGSSGVEQVICTVYDARDVRWAAGSHRPKVGDMLTAGPLRIESGVLELEFFREEKVAIEGPAQLDLTEPYSAHLRSGKLSAYVPKSGVGFSVTTPSATIVDLGTEFGVSVSGETSRVAVFDGRVRLTADRSGSSRLLTTNIAFVVDAAGAMRPTTLSAAAFPMIGRAISINPGSCTFEDPGRMRFGGIPTAFGYWSGPAYTVSAGPAVGIYPFDEPGMLRFLAPSSKHSGNSAEPKRSEVWQLMDLRPFRKAMVEGSNGKLSAMFNRVRDAQAGNTFGLTLAAFRGNPQNAAEYWQRRSEVALVVAEDEIVTDDDPSTWEKIEVSATLPSDTDFLILELRAMGPTMGAGASAAPPFPGHFADLVVFKLRVPLRESSIAANP